MQVFMALATKTAPINYKPSIAVTMAFFTVNTMETYIYKCSMAPTIKRSFTPRHTLMMACWLKIRARTAEQFRSRYLVTTCANQWRSSRGRQVLVGAQNKKADTKMVNDLELEDRHGQPPLFKL
jgi:hypothetical protein